MRRPWSKVAVFVTLIGLSLSPRTAAADSGATTPAAPTGLAMSLSGGTKLLSAGSWVSATKLDLHFQVQVTSGKLTPEVEVQPAGAVFTGKPNFQGQPISATGVALVPVQGLSNGKTYHWQARVEDSSGTASSWVPYAALGSTGPDIGVDLDAPSRPTIRSSTDPLQTRWYHTRSVILSWGATDSLSGIQGYSFVLGRTGNQTPPGTVTAASGARLSNLSDGIWYLAVRAVDKAGNWGQVSRFRLQLDRQAPRISWLSANRFTFNPYRGATTVRFRVSENSRVVLDLYRVGSRTPIAHYAFNQVRGGTVQSITWTGKDRRGQPVPRGYYFFAARAFDRAGNLTRINLGGIDVIPQKPQPAVGGVVLYPGDGRRIVVVLSQETLYAYDGNRLALKTYVTTGNPALPTPTGSYHIMAKYHPFEMISPWPPGSPYYYAPSWMQYAMLFRDGGYFLHDAPWRSAFGPGTNGPGQPGTNYGGTHGCVNVPPAAMSFLWSWAPVGTPVLVVR